MCGHVCMWGCARMCASVCGVRAWSFRLLPPTVCIYIHCQYPNPQSSLYACAIPMILQFLSTDLKMQARHTVVPCVWSWSHDHLDRQGYTSPLTRHKVCTASRNKTKSWSRKLTLKLTSLCSNCVPTQSLSVCIWATHSPPFKSKGVLSSLSAKFPDTEEFLIETKINDQSTKV